MKSYQCIYVNDTQPGKYINFRFDAKNILEATNLLLDVFHKEVRKQHGKNWRLLHLKIYRKTNLK